MPAPPLPPTSIPFACPPSPSSSSSSSNPSSYRLHLPNIHPSSVSLHRHSDQTNPTVDGNQHRSPSRFPVTNKLRCFHHTLFPNTPHPHLPWLPNPSTDDNPNIRLHWRASDPDTTNYPFLSTPESASDLGGLSSTSDTSLSRLISLSLALSHL
jgi:hypothetical protein